MSRKYHVVAKIDKVKNDPPEVGDAIWNGTAYSGTITEVTPILSGDDAMQEIYEQTFNQPLSELKTIIAGIVHRWRGSQEKHCRHNQGCQHRES